MRFPGHTKTPRETLIPSRSIAPDASTRRDFDRCKHRSDRQWFAAPLGKTNYTCGAINSGRALSTTFAVQGPKSQSPSTAHPRSFAKVPSSEPIRHSATRSAAERWSLREIAGRVERVGTGHRLRVPVISWLESLRGSSGWTTRGWSGPAPAECRGSAGRTSGIGQQRPGNRKASGNRNARRNHSPSRSLPPDASTWRLVVTASTDLTVLVRCLSGQDVMYPAPSWLRYPLIHDFRGSETQFEVPVHSPSTKGQSARAEWPRQYVAGGQPARMSRGEVDRAIFSSNRFAATSSDSRCAARTRRASSAAASSPVSSKIFQ